MWLYNFSDYSHTRQFLAQVFFPFSTNYKNMAVAVSTAMRTPTRSTTTCKRQRPFDVPFFVAKNKRKTLQQTYVELAVTGKGMPRVLNTFILFKVNIEVPQGIIL